MTILVMLKCEMRRALRLRPAPDIPHFRYVDVYVYISRYFQTFLKLTDSVLLQIRQTVWNQKCIVSVSEDCKS